VLLEYEREKMKTLTCVYTGKTIDPMGVSVWNYDQCLGLIAGRKLPKHFGIEFSESDSLARLRLVARVFLLIEAEIVAADAADDERRWRGVRSYSADLRMTWESAQQALDDARIACDATHPHHRAA